MFQTTNQSAMGEMFNQVYVYAMLTPCWCNEGLDRGLAPEPRVPRFFVTLASHHSSWACSVCFLLRLDCPSRFCSERISVCTLVGIFPLLIHPLDIFASGIAFASVRNTWATGPFLRCGCSHCIFLVLAWFGRVASLLQVCATPDWQKIMCFHFLVHVPSDVLGLPLSGWRWYPHAASLRRT